MASSGEAPPSLLKQVGMAGTAAVITVTFIHPIDVIKASIHKSKCSYLFYEYFHHFLTLNDNSMQSYKQTCTITIDTYSNLSRIQCPWYVGNSKTYNRE